MTTGFVALAISLGVSACGGGDSSEPSTTPVATSSPLRTAEISRYPRGSVERTFLEYWSDLQFRAWADVASYYDSDFRDFVGTTTLVGAKKLNASSYPLLKPKIVKVGPGAAGATTIYYTLTMADGSKELDSITWRKEEGDWQVIYDSRLDPELAQLALNQVEVKRHGALPSDPAKPPSPAAGRAAKQAEQQQARFLQQELDVNHP